MRVVILGAGGHGQVVADILLRARSQGGTDEPAGFLDDNPALAGQALLGLPVLGPFSALPDVMHDAVIVAIGNNIVRCALYERLRAKGERFAIARHPCAVLAADVAVDAGTMICAGVVVNTGSVIGANVILNTICSVDHHNRIGDHVHIAPGVRLGGEVVVGTGTMIGIGATVIPRCAIGEWSMVGAGAVVTKSLPGGVTAVGMPARSIKRY